jgi:hypothetical protein
MTKKLIKFLLYIQSNEIDGAIDFAVTPPPTFLEIKDNLYIYQWEYDPQKIFEVTVYMNDCKGGHRSHLLIKKVTAGTLDLTTDILTYGIYKRYDTNEVVKNTYGYMSWPGEYCLKVKTNPMSHRWLMNFFKKSTQISA